MIDLNCQLHAILANLRIVIYMVEDGQPNKEILHKIAAIQQLLLEYRCSLVANQVQECTNLIRKVSNIRVRTIALKQLQELFEVSNIISKKDKSRVI